MNQEIETTRGQLPFLGHVRELRQCLIHSLIAIGLCFGVTYAYSKEIFSFLMRPVMQALGQVDAKNLYFSGLTEPFLNDLKVAFYGALILACPFVLYQVWKFVAPGLKLTERKILLSLTFFSVLLFILGMAFAYYLVFPLGFQFFLSYTSESIRPIITIDQYLGLISRLLLSFGVVFEFPLVAVLLTLTGLVNAKGIAGFWRYAIVFIALLSAVLTPPDVASMMMMMVPMLLLYGISIVLAFVVESKNFNRPKK